MNAKKRRAAPQPKPIATESAQPPAWTFLTNHAHVLIMLSLNSGLVLREIAHRVGITERAVQKIIGDLEQEGFVQRVKVGRCNEYKLNLEKPLRHPIEQHRTIGEIITLIQGR